MPKKRVKQTEVLVPTGYAEKIQDCSEFIQGAIANHFLGVSDRLKTAFDEGKIAIEWGVEPKLWWRFCEKRRSDRNE